LKTLNITKAYFGVYHNSVAVPLRQAPFKSNGYKQMLANGVTVPL